MKLIIFAIALAYAYAIEDSDVLQKWTEFQVEFEKSYRSPIEERTRFNIFKDNLKEIETHNALYENGEVTYHKGITQFADWTATEFMEYVNRSLLDKPEMVGETYESTNVDIPDSVDWRKKKVVTAIKDQGQCGSCWAFSATGSIEGQYARKKGSLISVSEQELVDCSTQNNGCSGGLMTSAFDYVKKNGIRKEKDYPYKGKEGSCKSKKYKSVTKVSKYVNIKENSESDLQNAIANKGPISVAIDATQNLQLYKGGILNDPKCNSRALNHGVLAVGYGGSASSRYYIVKNSWGAKWGESGYFRLPLNKKNKCGIASMASYPVL